MAKRVGREKLSQRQAGLQPPVSPTPAPQEASAQPVRRRWWALPLVIGGLLAALLLVRAFFYTPHSGDHYTYLAAHFARGDLTVDTMPESYQDQVRWQGHRYLPLGPLPAVALIPTLPFLDLGRYKVIAWAGYLLTVLNVWLLYKVLGQVGVDGERRLWALLLFFGGTVYLSAAAMGTSWFFAHILTITFMLWAMHEMLGRGRPWLVGLALGLAAMTRLTSLFALPFFLWILWKRDGGRRTTDGGRRTTDDASPISQLAVPAGLMLVGLAGPLALLFAYNYVRFGSGLESGYAHAVLRYASLAQALDQGLFSLAHIPKNLFMLLFQGPLPYPSESAPVLQFPYMQPSQWGMGIFFTSPALLYAFRAGFKSPLAKACWLGVLSVLVPLVTYYGIGWLQFGYRYALDFMPLLLVLAALGLPKPMTTPARALVLASVVVNVWGSIFLMLWI